MGIMMCSYMYMWKALLLFVLVLGFAYIVWLKALKHEGVTKIVGQIIALATLILAIITLVYSGMSGWKYGKCSWENGKYMSKPYHHKGRGKHYGRGMMRQQMMEQELEEAE